MTTPFPGNRWDQDRAADLSKPEPKKEAEPAGVDFFKKAPAKTPAQTKKEQLKLAEMLRQG